MQRPSIPPFSFSGLKELQRRLLFTVGALIVYRIGNHIPIPGVDLEQFATFINQSSNNLVAYLSTISGGALHRCTIFSVGLSAYINVSMGMQIASFVFPALEKLRKEGEIGRQKINRYTRYVTFLVSILYSLGACHRIISSGSVFDSSNSFYAIATITLVGGALFLMWLSDQITNRGIGNGSSVIIFAGIVSNLPQTVVHFLSAITQEKWSMLTAALTATLFAAVTFFIVYMERAQRQITVNHPKRQQGAHIYAAQSSHLPLKINMAGIMPTIWSYAVFNTLMMLVEWLVKRFDLPFVFNEWFYMTGLSVMVAFFCFFQTAVTSNPKEMADNLKKSGSFIPGVRPGDQTSRYIDFVMTRLTVLGAAYLVSVVLLPFLLKSLLKMQLSLSGTSLLITIVVAMEFIGQVQSLLISHQYDSLLKKAKLKR